MTDPRLLTLAEWLELRPIEQGYALYMQGSRPGSELAGRKNPHAIGTAAHRAFCEGERRAVLAAQDSEE